jgi:hypothetical protein
MVWGTEGYVQEERLNKLGLYCYGGGSKDGQMSYYVYSHSDITFRLELSQKEFDKIEEHFKIYIRCRKLKKLKNEISSCGV